jgi:hypothetical protein
MTQQESRNRVGTPDEVASVTGSEAAFIAGAGLTLDGGFTASGVSALERQVPMA